MTEILPDVTTEHYQRLTLGFTRIGDRHPYLGLSDPDRVIESIIKRSVLARPFLIAGRSVLDVGSGVGVPGLPLALADPARPMFLLEPRTACISLIRWLCSRLSSLNVFALNERVETLLYTDYPPMQGVTRASLGWDTLSESLPASLYPIVKWGGPDVELPPDRPDWISKRIVCTPWNIRQELIWWGTEQLFHVKQSCWTQCDWISIN